MATCQHDLGRCALCLDLVEPYEPPMPTGRIKVRPDPSRGVWRILGQADGTVPDERGEPVRFATLPSAGPKEPEQWRDPSVGSYGRTASKAALKRKAVTQSERPKGRTERTELDVARDRNVALAAKLGIDL